MRDSDEEKKITTAKAPTEERQVPCDGKAFFESFYKSNLRDPKIRDRITLGAVTEPESRFHYNSVENSIIRAYTRLHPPPPGIMAAAWHAMQSRAERRLLDIGSGTGHWIDFFRETFLVAEAVGVEITETMARFLNEKYAETEGVTILQLDIGDEAFDPKSLGEPFDYISAIGVMFHIVDDAHWARAVANLAAALAPGGLMFVGDEFGDETRAVQFHKVDDFESWREAETAEGVPGEIRVNKRIRSLADWHAAVERCGLEVVELVRTDREPTITTPENDVLVLRRASSEQED